MHESCFDVVELKEDPIRSVRDAIERRIVAVVVLADTRIACDDPAKPVKFVPECVDVANAMTGFDVGGDPIRIIDEAIGVNDTAHSLGFRRGAFPLAVSVRWRARPFPR